MKAFRRMAQLLVACPVVFAVACDYGVGTGGAGSAVNTPDRQSESVKRPEAWDWRNDPNGFSYDLEYRLDKLPQEGQAAKIPWPDTYWPTYEDGYNARWQVLEHGKPVSKDTLSPAEKYDMAFNGWQPGEDFYKLKPYGSSNCSDKSWDKEYYDKLGPAAKFMAKYKGNWEAHDGQDSDGDGKTDECDDRDGIETWWGFCHAWVPAAILEDEPRMPVVYNGVKFEVDDIKGLLIAVYDRSDAKLIGGRCNGKDVKRDEKTGRILDSECRDINPGTLHVILANYLGIKKRAIAEDRTYNYEVWNQPVWKYKVESLKKITKKKALKLLKLPGNTTSYPYNKDAAEFYEVYTTVEYVTESSPGYDPLLDQIDWYTRTDKYHYILEVDADGKVIGGEWLGYSNTDHPDFLWLPISPRGGNPHIDLENVHMLLKKSLGGDEENLEFATYESTEVVSIPDNDPQGAVSAIDVPDDFEVAGKVKVEVIIKHTYIGDLVVKLRKGGKEVVLHDRTGSSTDDIHKTYTVSDFAGVSAKGKWELVAADNANLDTGQIESWKLFIPKKTEGGGGNTIEATSSDTPIDIPNNTPEGIESTITIEDNYTVKGVSVTVDIEHSYVGALQVSLKHGTKVVVLQHADYSISGEVLKKTYNVSDFNGDSSAGQWSLNVADMDEYEDTGKLNSWTIVISY